MPLDGYFRQDVWSKLEEHFATTDAEKVMEELGLDIRYTFLEPASSFIERAIPSPLQIPEIGSGRKNFVIQRDNGWLEDEYGICRVPTSTGLYWVYTHHPLAEAGLTEVSNYQFPDANLSERYQDIYGDVARWGDNYFTAVELWNIFKTSWEFRGFEQYMMDLGREAKLVEILADRVLEHRIEQSKQLIKSDIDMIVIMGDIAWQDGMMISPKMWRNFYKPRLKTWIDEIRKERDIYLMFHSDGNMETVFADLIEIGFDVINPIQPECMDVVELKRRYGNQVCFHGSISCQKTLPFGTADDVADEVRQRISCCGQDGGLILSPSNTIQPDVSLENILAIYNTAKNFSLS